MMTCQACGGELVELGTLGRRLHLRCRSCGLDTNTDVEPSEPEPDPPRYVSPFNDALEGVDSGELTEWETNEERRR